MFRVTCQCSGKLWTGLTSRVTFPVFIEVLSFRQMSVSSSVSIRLTVTALSMKKVQTPVKRKNI